MRRVVSCVGCAFALFLTVPAAAAPPVDAAGLRQIAGILEYVAGDYRGAVDDRGQVVHQAEYDEQVSMLTEVEALAQRAGLPRDGALGQRLGALQLAVRDRKPPAEVAAGCRSIRAQLVSQYGIVLTPNRPPSHAAGQRLYVENGCGTCHGADGGANTEAAAKLDPQPANFLDPERVATVSPYRAYHALTAGLPGTAMVSYAHLADADRWSLAFYVLSLRHAQADLAAGKQALTAAGLTLPTSAEALSARSEEDLLVALAPLPEAQRAPALAYLRAQAPFATDSAAGNTNMDLARKQLRDGLARYQAGDAVGARQLFVSAYLDGFEPHEASLAVRDGELMREIERAMLGVRQAAAQGAPASRLHALIGECEALLLRAERGRSSPATAFWSALTISLREGLEIALLIAALLGLVRKRGQPALGAYVHGGWALAVVAGVVTWWGASELISGMHRELAEGIAALLAAVVLLGVTHWLLGQLTAKRFMGFVADKLGNAASRSAAFGVLSLSFIAVYREALEIVLFFQALLLDAGDHAARVWLGAAAGLVVLCAVALVLKRLGQRLRPRPFMLLSSALLAALAFVLAGKGVRALQEAGVLGITDLAALPELPWLGMWPTLEGALAQGVVLLALTASAIWPLIAQSREPLPNPGTSTQGS